MKKIVFPSFQATNRAGVPDEVLSKCGNYRVSRLDGRSSASGDFHWRAEVNENGRWHELSRHFHRRRAQDACQRHSEGDDPRAAERQAEKRLRDIDKKRASAAPLTIEDLVALIRRNRETLGISQIDAAKKVGLSAACWNHIENLDANRAATYATLRKMGEAVGLEIGYHARDAKV